MALILYKDILAVLHIFDICSSNESLLSIIYPKLLTFNDGFIIILPKVTTGNLNSVRDIFNSTVLFMFNRRLFSKSQLLIGFAHRQISWLLGILWLCEKIESNWISSA